MKCRNNVCAFQRGRHAWCPGQAGSLQLGWLCLLRESKEVFSKPLVLALKMLNTHSFPTLSASSRCPWVHITLEKKMKDLSKCQPHLPDRMTESFPNPPQYCERGCVSLALFNAAASVGLSGSPAIICSSAEKCAQHGASCGVWRFRASEREYRELRKSTRERHPIWAD